MAVLLRQPSAGDERAIHAHDTGTTTCMFISKGEQSIDLYVPTLQPHMHSPNHHVSRFAGTLDLTGRCICPQMI